MSRSTLIFNNPIDPKTIRKADKSKAKYLKKYGDDHSVVYPLSGSSNPTLYDFLGIKNIQITPDGEKIDPKKSLIIGNIRMGFGHYRISMAIASAAHSMGYKPYWFDLCSYPETTGGKVIAHLNGLYSMGSRWSQKYPLFNRFYWEPLNSEGFRQLSYNAIDQKVAELMVPVYSTLPKDIPFIATHVWPAQAAIHAQMKRVINVIPDNWPMALHLSEGSIHTVQTPSCYWGYRTLKGMAKNHVLQPMPDDQLFDVGHYIDHELLVDLEKDVAKRMNRLNKSQALRILLTVGGAGAQQDIMASIINKLLPLVEQNKVVLLINVGDHKKVWESLLEKVPNLSTLSTLHFDEWKKTTEFADQALKGVISGCHVFYHQDIFAAVYSTNLLMRATDLLVTKPSELAFYPVPKLMIKRIGGHEAYGAIRTSELGDGTIECESTESILQMVDLLLHEPQRLKSMNEAILKAKAAGLYNGAYRVVELAINKG